MSRLNSYLRNNVQWRHLSSAHCQVSPPASWVLYSTQNEHCYSIQPCCERKGRWEEGGAGEERGLTAWKGRMGQGSRSTQSIMLTRTSESSLGLTKQVWLSPRCKTILHLTLDLSTHQNSKVSGSKNLALSFLLRWCASYFREIKAQALAYISSEWIFSTIPIDLSSRFFFFPIPMLFNIYGTKHNTDLFNTTSTSKMCCDLRLPPE